MAIRQHLKLRADGNTICHLYATGWRSGPIAHAEKNGTNCVYPLQLDEAVIDGYQHRCNRHDCLMILLTPKFCLRPLQSPSSQECPHLTLLGRSPLRTIPLRWAPWSPGPLSRRSTCPHHRCSSIRNWRTRHGAEPPSPCRAIQASCVSTSTFQGWCMMKPSHNSARLSRTFRRLAFATAHRGCAS